MHYFTSEMSLAFISFSIHNHSFKCLYVSQASCIPSSSLASLTLVSPSLTSNPSSLPPNDQFSWNNNLFKTHQWLFPFISSSLYKGGFPNCISEAREEEVARTEPHSQDESWDRNPSLLSRAQLPFSSPPWCTFCRHLMLSQLFSNPTTKGRKK